MFVVGLPSSSVPDHCLGFSQPICSAKQSLAGMCPRESWCWLFIKCRKVQTVVEVKPRTREAGRACWPHPGGDWNILELSQTGSQWAVLGPLYSRLVWQLFLNWKLTVTSVRPHWDSWLDSNFQLLQQTDHCRRTEHRYTLYLFTTGTLNTFKRGERGDIVLILYTPETRHHKVLLVEISPRTAQQVQW